MIEIKNLSHSFGKKKILDKIDLTLNDGSIMGLVGINGAGKSTLLRLISGVYVPDEGEILCDGKPISLEEKRQKLFFLPDDPYFTLNTTGNSMFDFYKVFYPDIDRNVFDKHMESFNLDAKKPIRNFSKGMRRQLFVSLAIAIKPRYLLLDEAFDGLDPLARLNFKRIINEFVEENETSVIISSHSLRELEDFCDCYAMIDSQKISSSGNISESVSCFCKFQLAYKEEISESAFWGFPVVSLEKSGRFVRIIMRGDAETLKAELEKTNPLIIDEMAMDFEEMFICEVRERGKIQ